LASFKLASEIEWNFVCLSTGISGILNWAHDETRGKGKLNQTQVYGAGGLEITP